MFYQVRAHSSIRLLIMVVYSYFTISAHFIVLAFHLEFLPVVGYPHHLCATWPFNVYCYQLKEETISLRKASQLYLLGTCNISKKLLWSGLTNWVEIQNEPWCESFWPWKGGGRKKERKENNKQIQRQVRFQNCLIS